LLDAFVRRVQEVLARHDGTLVDVTVGDKGSYLSIVFGAPTAHEDDPARAAATALELLELPGRHSDIGAIGPIRIGSARGRICAGSFGGPTRRAYGVAGREVNVAARLMEVAGPGRIVVSERVATALGDRFELRPLGSIAVKGLDDPPDAFELRHPSVGRAHEGPRVGTSSTTGPALVGRSAETATLSAALDEVERGAGRSVLLRGEPGVGKSRLMDAALDEARRRGMRIVKGVGSPVDQSTPFAAWQPIFAALVETDGRAPTDADVERLLAPLAEEDSDRAALLGAVLPFDLPETDVTLQMTPEARQENTLRMLVRLFEGHRGEGALVLAMDDSQWIDSSSWALLLRLVREVQRALIIVAARTDIGADPAPMEALIQVHGLQTIELQGLAHDDVLTLICQALRVDSLPDAVARFVGERAEGHPFFSLELAYALRDAGSLEIAAGRATVAADLERLEFPESIEGVIAIRLDRLTPEDRSTLKVASVLGQSFSAEVIADVLEPGLADGLDGRLAGLEARDLISADGEGSRRGYSFRHVLIRDVVYSRLLYAQRRQLHRRAAEYFEQLGQTSGSVTDGLLAYHWEAAGVPGRAIEHLEPAGSNALRDGSFREAAGFLDRAIILAGANAGRALGNEPTLDPVDVPARRTATWRWLAAQARYRLGDLDESRDLAEAAVGVLDRRPPSDGLALGAAVGMQAGTQLLHRLLPGRFIDRAPAVERERLQHATFAYLNLAELNYLASRKGRSAYAALRALNLAEQAGPSLALVETYGAICIIGGLVGRHGLADRYARLGRSAAAQVGQPYATAINLHQVCLYRSGTGPAGRLFVDYETGVGLFRSLGDKGRLRDCLGLAGIAAHLFGRLELGRRFLSELLATHDEGERSLPWTWGVTWLAAIDLRQGHTEEALAGLRRANASQGSERLDMTSITVHGLLSVALLRVGRVDEARVEADRTRSLIAASGGHPTGHPVLDGYAGLAEVSLAEWDAASSAAERKRARRQVEEACLFLDRYRRVFPIGEPAFRLYRGHLAARVGGQRTAVQEWKRSLRAAEALDMRYETARAHLALGTAVKAERVERDTHLGAAAAALTEMGVPADAPGLGVIHEGRSAT
jgi:tetratricopeptide (TPR) repeat protein